MKDDPRKVFRRRDCDDDLQRVLAQGRRIMPLKLKITGDKALTDLPAERYSSSEERLRYSTGPLE